MIYVECKPDLVLLKSVINIPKKQFIHEGGKANVCRRLERQRNCKGLVDEDPGSIQPPYMKSLKWEDLSQHELKILRDNSNNNCLIVLCPRLEEWILKTVREVGIDITKYCLPNNAIKLHKEININLGKFERLVGELKNKDSERLKTLKRLLKP